MAHHPEESLPGPKVKAAPLPPILFILAAALIWSTGGLFIKWSTFNAFELSFGRALLAALTVAVFTRREGFGFNRMTAITCVLYAGLLLCFVVATKLTTAANAIFLQYTSPVYLLLLEPLVYKEKFRLVDLITVIVCLAGMSLFFVGQLDTRSLTGNLVALASGLFMALYFLLLRHPRSQKVNRASSVIYGNLLLVLLTAPFIFNHPPHVSVLNLGIVLYLGVVQLGLGYTLFTLGIARGVRSLDAGIIGYIEPVLNPVWVFLFLGEQPSHWALLGGGIIIFAVISHTLWTTQAKGKQKRAGPK
ncbi:MAG TPA: EamA family transporter [Pyrinomonadaceae bacterium]